LNFMVGRLRDGDEHGGRWRAHRLADVQLPHKRRISTQNDATHVWIDY
jgi:hypothetical protein